MPSPLDYLAEYLKWRQQGWDEVKDTLPQPGPVDLRPSTLLNNLKSRAELVYNNPIEAIKAELFGGESKPEGSYPNNLFYNYLQGKVSTEPTGLGSMLNSMGALPQSSNTRIQIGAAPEFNFNPNELAETGLNIAGDPLGLMPGPDSSTNTAITRYLKRDKNYYVIPDVAAREAATQEYIAKMEAMGLGPEGREFATMHPRIAAHINPQDQIMEARTGAGTNLGRAFENDPTKIDVGYNPNYPYNMPDPVTGQRNPDYINERRAETFHEGTHVAQALGMDPKRLRAFYQLGEMMTNSLGHDSHLSYWLNPFELSPQMAAKGKTGFDIDFPRNPITKPDTNKRVFEMYDGLVAKYIRHLHTDSAGNLNTAGLRGTARASGQTFYIGDSVEITTASGQQYGIIGNASDLERIDRIGQRRIVGNVVKIRKSPIRILQTGEKQLSPGRGRTLTTGSGRVNAPPSGNFDIEYKRLESKVRGEPPDYNLKQKSILSESDTTIPSKYYSDYQGRINKLNEELNNAYKTGNKKKIDELTPEIQELERILNMTKESAYRNRRYSPAHKGGRK